MGRKRRIIEAPPVDRTCLYCGEIAYPISGEHVVPDSLGGTKKIKPVCRGCNNGVLSNLDTQLCSLTPLGFLAIEHSVGKAALYTWNVDPEMGGMLVEGEYRVAGPSRVFPQIIFGPGKWHFRADYEEMLAFGSDDLIALFLRRINDAFGAFKLGDTNALMFECASNPFQPAAHCLPPRIFTRGSLNDLRAGTRPILRYLDDADRRHALNELDRGIRFSRSRSAERIAVPPVGAFQFAFVPELVARALRKIGFNLIRFVVGPRVDRTTFPAAVATIMGSTKAPGLVDECGFIAPAELNGHHADASHRFWLYHDGRRWIVCMSFFGGQAAAVATVPGPKLDDWARVTVTAPVNINRMSIEESRVFVAPAVNVRWESLESLFPSIGAYASREGRWVANRR